MKTFSITKLISVSLAVLILIFSLASCSGNKTGENVSTDTGDVESDSVSDTQPDAGMTFEPLLDDNGKEIGQKATDSDGVLLYTEEWDNHGRTVKAFSYNPDGTQDAEEYISYASEDGDEISQYITVKYYYDEESGEMTQYNKSYFNPLKQLTDSFSCKADDSLICFFKYEYDEVGNCTKESEFSSSYALVRATENEYDEQDRLVKETEIDEAGNTVSSTLYEYGDDGKLAKQTECYADGTPRTYCVFSYDENGEESGRDIYVKNEQGEFVKYN